MLIKVDWTATCVSFFCRSDDEARLSAGEVDQCDGIAAVSDDAKEPSRGRAQRAENDGLVVSVFLLLSVLFAGSNTAWKAAEALDVAVSRQKADSAGGSL